MFSCFFGFLLMKKKEKRKKKKENKHDYTNVIN